MRRWSHGRKQHCHHHWPPTLKQKSHDASVAEEGQVEPSLKWRVAEEPQNAEVVAEPEGQSHAESQTELSVAEHVLTAPAVEPYHHEARDKWSRDGPVESGWKLPCPGTYGSRLQFCQGGAHQHQALAGVDWTTGYDLESVT